MDPEKFQLLTSPRAFQEALRLGFEALASANCREVCISDPDFSEWPLNERGVIDHLGAWAMSHRKLTVLAIHFNEVPRMHPRWVAWRQHWSHVVDCRVADESDRCEVTSQFIASGVQLIQMSTSRPHRRGSVSTEAVDIRLAQEKFDAVLQRSQESFPPTVLGL